MTSTSKTVYIDKLSDIVNKYNNTYHRTIKTKPVYVKANVCIDFNIKNQKKSTKFRIGDDVRISKHKNIFPKSYVLN